METQMPLSVVTHKVSWSPVSMREKLRSLIKTHGGKFYLSGDHLAICRQAMIGRKVWFEDCAGGANFTLQSDPTPNVQQVINEIDPTVWNVWKCFTQQSLYEKTMNRLYNVNVTCRETMEVEFMSATQVVNAVCGAMTKGEWLLLDSTTEDERATMAVAVIVNRCMSRGGMGETFAWQDRERGGQPGEINSWKTRLNEHMPRVFRRMENVVPICRNTLDILGGMALEESKNGPEEMPFYYIDPPYVPKTRTAPDVYRYEWTTEQHITFLGSVRHRRQPMAICGYENDLYKQALGKWTMHRFAIVNHSSQAEKKEDRIECLWTNF